MKGPQMRHIVLSVCFCFLMNLTLFAQQREIDSTINYILNPVTVTATVTEVPRNLVSPSVSVITQDVLEQQPHKSVFSIVSQQVPGIFVTEQGMIGFGVNTPIGQIFIRGIGGNPNTEVLTLIDGRPQYMGMYGHPVNDSYLSAHVERVEVIRGPASLLYGSNAMGGVINLITSKSLHEGFSGIVNASYGSYNSHLFGITTGYQHENWSTTACFTNVHTDGHRPYSEYSGNSGYLKSSYSVNERYSVTLDGSVTKFNTYDPGTVTSPYINNWMHITRGYAGVSVNNDFGKSKGGAKLFYNFGHHELSPYYGNKNWTSDDFAATATVFQSLFLLPNNTITVGATYNQFGGNGRNTDKDYGYHSVYQYAFYTSVQQLVTNALSLNGGLRFDHNEMFGNALTPQFGASYKFYTGTTLRGFIGKGFRSPTVRELYLFPAPTPNLKPEELWNYEIGISQIIASNFTADLALFQQEGNNMIRTDGVYPNLRLSNSGVFVHRGIEASGIYFPLPNLQLNGSYSFIDVGNNTRSIPKHKMYASVQYMHRTASATISAQHIETIYGSDNKKNKMPNYTVLNAEISTRLLPMLTVNLSAENLLDETYYTVFGYPMPGRTFTIGIRAQH